MQITKSFIKLQDIVKMTQALPGGQEYAVEWRRIKKDKWLPNFTTTSTFPICPNDGQFKKCEDCSAWSEDKEEMLTNCAKRWQLEAITDEEMVSRAIACERDGKCKISFGSYDNE